MIGIVVVSHSPDLARATVALALEMVAGEHPRIAIAAGAGEDASGAPIIGTDAVRVAEAIDEVASPEGVLVFTDLGSAVLSAGLALEFLSTTTEVRLSRAPFVEGIVAGIVLAAAGASLDDADRETADAMAAKNEQLGDTTPVPEPVEGPTPVPEPVEGPTPVPEPVEGPTAVPDPTPVPELVEGPTAAVDDVEVTLTNRLGLHARPAAAIVAAMAPFDAAVTVVDTAAPDRVVSASSLMGMMTLGAQGGAVLRISGTGPDAAAAVETIRAMAADGFGEE
jgi:PTS hybrid protein